ncbi:hypothetical protein PPYR_07631 [Photinus pyralis]|uniref:serine C-palmitoyltransferase n=1 Tax=Photinus pyralis TaxID=7054 RepID=A0A5N4AR05_PHOPY|nr:serine palmitoyltransferase 2-like [Photinus pyralis]XP_031341411.1 serine palmitoyltransferase 2-like [Photinus pyralis]KAB0799751.1 hypothetical protein PPYR_07631 [Photinus pyralis]
MKKFEQMQNYLKNSFEKPSLVTMVLTSISFYILMFIGYFTQAVFPRKICGRYNRQGYPELYDRFTHFFSRYVHRRMGDCWEYPICSSPGAELVFKERITEDNGWTFKFTGRKRKCINLGSYNYLGFSDKSGYCTEMAIKALHTYGISTGATRERYGNNEINNELEKLTAEFVGTEDAVALGMGFATNSLNIPALVSGGCLIISDEKNHASIVLGAQVSGATVRVFRHNDLEDLEDKLKAAVYYGQPIKENNNNHVPWRKICIIVEGIYSMDASIVPLPEIIALKKRYKAYLYLDEAHSIGALGPSGKGVVEYFGCNARDVDLLMGTYAKSFGSAGGYIAGSKELISLLRQTCSATKYASSMSPPVAAQVIAVLQILLGKDGTNLAKNRLKTLAINTQYVRRRLAQTGVIIYGHQDAPVVPILLYRYSKIASTVRALIQRNVAVPAVGYPVTPILESRMRLCISATHTKEQLDYALAAIEEVSDEMGLKHLRLPRHLKPVVYEDIAINL